MKSGVKYIATTADGDVELRLVDKEVQTDLALMKAEGNFHALSLSNKPVEKLGSSIFTVGFPMPKEQGFSPKVTKGVICSTKGHQDSPTQYQIDAAIELYFPFGQQTI